MAVPRPLALLLIFALARSAHSHLDTNEVTGDVTQGDAAMHDDVINGINLNDLTPEEEDVLLADLDNVIIADLDMETLKHSLALRKDTSVSSQGLRKKRWVPLAVAAGRVAYTAARTLFRNSARAGRPSWRGSRSGPVRTTQYTRRGDYSTARRDFDRFNPTGRTNFGGGRVSGSQGQVGRHTVRVRDGSSGNSRPTLEVRTPRSDGTTSVRKFRYE